MYWRGVGTDANTDTNWSLTSGGGATGHVPTSSDDAVFDLNSVGANCTMSAPLSVGTISFTTDWTKTFSLNGFNLTSVGSQSYNGKAGSSFSLNASLIMTGDGDLTFGSGIATLTVTSMSIDVRGTGNISVAKTCANFVLLTCGYSTKITTITGASIFSPRSLSVGTGTLTNSNASTALNPTQAEATTFYSCSGTLNGASDWKIQFAPTADTLTYTLPAINYTGSGAVTILMNATYNMTLTMNGSASFSGAFYIYHSQAGKTFTFSLNNYTLSCAGLFCGCNNASGIITYNWGTGNISITSLNTSYNLGTTNFNCGTSQQWTCSGAWTFGSTWTVDMSTSTVTYTGAGTSTTQGKTFYDVVITGGVRTITYAGTSPFHSIATSGTGGIAAAVNQNISIVTSMLFDGSANVTLNSVMTISTGVASGDCFRLASGVGTISMTTGQIDLQGDGYLNINKATTFLNLTTAYSGKTNKLYGSTTVVTLTLTGVFTLATGSFQQDQAITHSRATSEANPLVIGAGTWNGTGAYTLSNTHGSNYNFPAITYTGSGTLSIIRNSTGTGSSTCTMTGNLNWGTANIIIYQFLVGTTFTFDTGANYSFTCGSLAAGCGSGTTSVATFNWNASVVSCTSFLGSTYNVGTTNYNMMTSAWTCSGNWTWGSTWTVTLDTFSLTITNTATISGVTKNFYTLTLNAANKVITFATGNCTFQDLYIEPNTTVDFFAGMTYTFTTYTNTAWDGSAGNLVTIRSTTWGTAVNFTFPASKTVRYMAIMDIIVSNTTVASTSSNLGGDSGWTWDNPRFWIGGHAGNTTDSNETQNWAASSGGAGGAGVPDNTCNVVFDTNSSGYACTFTANFACKSLMTTSGWNKNFSMGGYTLTSVNAVEFNGIGTLTFDSTLTISGDGTFKVAAGVGTITATSLNLTVQGSVLTLFLKAVILNNLTHAYPSTVCKIVGINGCCQMNGVWRLGNGSAAGSCFVLATITVNQTTETNPIVFNSGYILTFVSSNLQINANGTNQTFNLPGIVNSGSTSMNIVMTAQSTAVGTNTINIQGDILMGSICEFQWYNARATNNTLIINTNNYALSCSNFTPRLSANTSTTTFNFGSSIINCTALRDAPLAAGTTNLNFQTSTWYCPGSWTMNANYNVDPGTSLVTFNASTTTTITSAGKSFYDVVIAKASNVAVTQADALVCHSLTVNSGASGNYSAATFGITSTSSVQFSSTGTLTVASIIITGDGDFRINSAVGVITTTNLSLAMRGTGTLAIDKALSMINLTVSYTGKTITNSSASDITLRGSLLIGNAGASGTFTSNMGIIIDATADLGFGVLNIEGSPTWNGIGAFTITIDQNGQTISLPAITYTGSGLWTINTGSSVAGTSTVNMAGALSVAALSIYNNRNTAQTLVFNTANYALTCSALAIGNNTASSTTTINLGSSTVISTSLVNTYNTGTFNLTLTSGTWTCSGNWTYGSTWTVTVSTGLVHINAASIVTNNSKGFYNLQLDATITLADSISMNRLLVEPGAIITFTAGATYVVAAYVFHDLDGTLSQHVVLQSSIPGSYWNLNLPSATVSYVDVTDSDNTAGARVNASNGTNTGSHNLNWLFTVATGTWFFLAMKNQLAYPNNF